MNFRLISILALGVAATAAHAVTFIANFDSLTNNTAVGGAYAANGLTFSGATVKTVAGAVSGSNVAEGSSITATFSTAVESLSFYYKKSYNSALTVTLVDSEGDSFGGSVGKNQANGWKNFSTGTGNSIASVTITGASAFSIDDFAISSTANPVPEPASMAAIGVGLLALRRRKKA